MENIATIYKMLDWRQPENVQKEGRRLAREIKDLSLLYNPVGATPSAFMACWEVLCEKSDDDLLPFLEDFLEYIIDSNRIASDAVTSRLMSFSGDLLYPYYIKAVNSAISRKDIYGLVWIGALAELLDNTELKAKLRPDLVERLMLFYKQYEWDEDDDTLYNEYLKMSPISFEKTGDGSAS